MNATTHGPRSLLEQTLLALAAVAAASAQAAPNSYWKFELLYSFQNAADGRYPQAGLVESSPGVFWGTTSEGGARRGRGTVYKFVVGSAPTVMYTFPSSGVTGAKPMAELLPVGHLLYGTTAQGGVNGQGAVFSISTHGGFSLLHSFAAFEGTEPSAALVRAANGSFYGTTATGGSGGHGTVFRVDSSGLLTVLHDFFALRGGGTDGSGSISPLVQHPNGDFYGTTAMGGVDNGGSAFRIGANGDFTLLRSFTGVAGQQIYGCRPFSGLALAADGDMVGTNTECGSFGGGTLYRLKPDGTLTWLQSFIPDVDGAASWGEVVQRSDGKFYGSLHEGAFGCGSVFAKSYTGNLSRLHAWSADATKGCGPAGALLSAADGALYGTTVTGGAHGRGTIYRLRRIVTIPGE